MHPITTLIELVITYEYALLDNEIIDRFLYCFKLKRKRKREEWFDKIHMTAQS